MSMNTDLKVVYKSLLAKTPQELTAKMLANNLRSGMNFKYNFIQFDGKQWVAWFMEDASEMIRERINDIANNNSGSRMG